MDKNIILTQVATLFLMMAVGFYARKRNFINAEINRGLTDLLLNITAPMIAISSFNFAFSREKLIGAGIVFSLGVGTHLVAILLSKFLFWKAKVSQQKILRMATVFSNCGFMGYPILGSFYGSQGIFYTSIYVMVFNIFIWTFGVALFTGKTDLQCLKKALLNPGILSVFIGMIIFLFSIKLPEPVSQTLQIVGSMNTPLSMLIIGGMIADIKTTDLFSGHALYYGALIRLVVMPLLVLTVFKSIGFHGILPGVCLLLTAMPVAALTVPLAEQNCGDAVFASRLVFLTTILSVFTIPIFILLL